MVMELRKIGCLMVSGNGHGGLFQVTKRQTRGRISFERMRTVLFRIAVKLDFARINPHAAEPT